MTDFPRRSAVSRLFAALALYVAAVFLHAQADPAQEIRRSERLAPGIEHLEIRRGDGILVLVTVDGRQPKKSVGMTIGELALLMTGLGCVEAINLDGGGSTTMVIGNRIVNNPSDATGERPVSDALLVFPRK